MPVIRTCLGCRGRAEKSTLIRVVATDHRLVVDQAHRRPGRGGYLHPDPDCLRRAIKRRAFGRALRQPALDPTAAIDELERLVQPHRLV